MKKEKLIFLKPKEGDSIGQWLIEQGISAGFPSPADDFKEIRISLDKELVKNTDSTFYARVSGDSMKDAYIAEGDMVLMEPVKESSSLRNGTIVSSMVPGSGTTLKYFSRRNNYITQ